ncbi:MAG: hypothetical protein NPIRA01_14940 [Nitrospirales bacterium]|nr:MAG: hypothetical protein NPIRA01_14940 [Nitrospirales bacterium]
MYLVCLNDHNTPWFQRTFWCVTVGFLLSGLVFDEVRADESTVIQVTQQEASPLASDTDRKLKQFRVSPGELESALTSFAKEGGVHLTYDATLMKRRQTQGVSGKFTLDDALNRLLAGTGPLHRPNHTGIIRVFENSNEESESTQEQQGRDTGNKVAVKPTATPLCSSRN